MILTPISSTSKKNRCDACHKKVGIMGHSCKCGKLFCISHLQAEEHQCTYDYKTEGRLQLEKEQLVGPLRDKMIERI